MALTRAEIVEQLIKILGEDRVVTDEEVLKRSSVDRFRRFEEIHGVFTRPLPAAVVYVESAAEAAEVLRFADKHGINVVPRTGQTATEGGLETAVENSIVLDGSRMNKILSIDTYNMQATCQCGTPLQVLEDRLRALGYTTGHSPQSKPMAHLGGLVATRSIGQFSTLYGGIEDMVVGLEAVFPGGHVVRIKNVPRRAAGPDIRHVIIGNEGALCFITEVTVKIHKYMPENNIFLGYTLESMKTGFEILREVMVNGYRPSVTRLYDPEDGSTSFSHFAEGKCVLIFMTEGPKAISQATAAAIEEIVARYPECKKVDSRYFETWFANLNWDASDVARERAEILETKNIGNTTEISASWDKIYDIYKACVERIRSEVPDMTLVGGHASHCYINGTNLYFVHYYNVVDCKPEEEVTKYHLPIKKIIVEETLKAGGSMCHHHGVGKYRAPWIKEEHGSAYYILETLKQAFDPRGIMNKGTIFPL
ncbi:MAG TPA: FAD-binding oxidoreductase [Bacillota bacterium]|nr:FAD-binding oxidoreductase [Bacillota bacterium]